MLTVRNYFALVGVRSIVISVCVCVCMSVCLSLRSHNLKYHMSEHKQGVCSIIHCVSKTSTFKLSVTLSKLNQFSKFLYCWKAYEICYKTHTTSPTSP